MAVLINMDVTLASVLDILQTEHLFLCVIFGSTFLKIQVFDRSSTTGKELTVSIF